MKTLWIHIGMAKTASTAIQNFCKENAEVMAKYGFCYPVFPFHYTGISKAHNGRFLLGMIKDENGKRDKEQEQKNFKEGIEIVNGLFRKYDNILISDESIWRGMDMEKKDLWEVMVQEAEKGDFSLRVIVYLRRQDKFLQSQWNQQVKRDWLVDTWEQFAGRVNNYRLNYYQKLEKMASIIGKENIIVRRFDGGNFVGGSIYADFFDALGIPLTDEYQISQEVRNIGLYGNMHEIKRVLNGLLRVEKDRDMQMFFMERLQECSEISKQQYPSEMMSGDEISAFLKTYEEGNRKVAEEYLHETGTELFDNTVKDVTKWQKDNPYMIDDLIRFVGVMSIYLYQENQKLKNKIKKLEKSKKQLLKDTVKRILK